MRTDRVAHKILEDDVEVFQLDPLDCFSLLFEQMWTWVRVVRLFSYRKLLSVISCSCHTRCEGLLCMHRARTKVTQKQQKSGKEQPSTDMKKQTEN